ncbi:MAG: hypothetical protein HKN20_12940 [Gemmatimonadetes bacterium]|nr:hypothetical protein [Gemmatimonadota bacterium]
MAIAIRLPAQEPSSGAKRDRDVSRDEAEIAFQYFDAIMQITSIELSMDAEQEHEFKRDMAVGILSSLADRLGDRNHNPSYDEISHALRCLHVVRNRIADKYVGNADGFPGRREKDRFEEYSRELTGLHEVLAMIRDRKVDADVIKDRWFRVER